MNQSDSVLTCTARLEWQNAQGVVQRRLLHKVATLRLIRNEHKLMYLEVSADKSAPVRLEMKGIRVHNKFKDEGKTSIQFRDASCILYISNAPPSSLISFLRTLFVKMTGKEQSPKLSFRAQMLSSKQRQFEEISPVTTSDLEHVRKKLKKTTGINSSPLSRKRKADDDVGIGHVSKRLHSSTPVSTEILTIEQKEVLDACLSGRNVFFTGSAGTGKSFLLRKIIAALPPDVTTATASTGVAACHIGGITLHQFAGIGDGGTTLERACTLALKPTAAQIWRKCKHLIIDEISMIEAQYFEKIEAVARRVRKNEKPFGGIQLILCGDFLQLPPVVKQNIPNTKKFCFQTQAWERCVQLTYELKQVHRQKDCEFIDILNNIRVGIVNDEIANKLLKTSKQKIERNGILATRLCSHTKDANAINESKLNALPGESKTFEAQDSNKYLSAQLDQQTSVSGKLELKIGAQVMLLKNVNISEGLVNGARGIVTEFRDDLPVIRLKTGKEYIAKHERWMIKTAGGDLLTRIQVPLKLAWAFSIHKSQGLTLDCVEMSLSRVFEAGQAYVALSRAQSLDSLRILDFKSSQVWANPDVLDFYKRLHLRMESNKFIPLGKKAPSGMGVKKTINKKLFENKPIVSIS